MVRRREKRGKWGKRGENGGKEGKMWEKRGKWGKRGKINMARMSECVGGGNPDPPNI